MADPNWNEGFYYDGSPPHTGLKLARRKLPALPRSPIFLSSPCWASFDLIFLRVFLEIATITYRSGPEWDIRFGRQLRESSEPEGQRIPALCPDYLIETYLDHQASVSFFFTCFPHPRSSPYGVCPV